MHKFSVETAGFVALTLTELLLQECVMKGVLKEQDVKRLLQEAARRHDQAAVGDLDKIEMNMHAAHMIRALMHGLAPLFGKERLDEKKKGKKKKRTNPVNKPK